MKEQNPVEYRVDTSVTPEHVQAELPAPKQVHELPLLTPKDILSLEDTPKFVAAPPPEQKRTSEGVLLSNAIASDGPMLPHTQLPFTLTRTYANREHTNQIGRDMPAAPEVEFSPDATKKRLQENGSFKDKIKKLTVLEARKVEAAAEAVQVIEETLAETPNTFERAKEQWAKLQKWVKKIRIEDIIPEPPREVIELGSDENIKQELLQNLLHKAYLNITNNDINAALDATDKLDGGDPDRRYRMYRALQQETKHLVPIYKAAQVLDRYIVQKLQEGSLHLNTIDAYINNTVEVYVEENNLRMNEDDVAIFKGQLLNNFDRYKQVVTEKENAHIEQQQAQAKQAEEQEAQARAQAEQQKAQAEEQKAQEDRQLRERQIQRRNDAVQTIITRWKTQEPTATETEEARLERNINTYMEQFPGLNQEDREMIRQELTQQIRRINDTEQTAINIAEMAYGQFDTDDRHNDAHIRQTIENNVNQYLQQHPDAANLPRNEIVAQAQRRVQNRLAVIALSPTTPSFIRRVTTENQTQLAAAAPPAEPPRPPADKPTQETPRPTLSNQLVSTADRYAQMIFTKIQNGDTDIDTLVSDQINIYEHVHGQLEPAQRAEFERAIRHNIRYYQTRPTPAPRESLLAKIGKWIKL